jgi:hypothetical protein
MRTVGAFVALLCVALLLMPVLPAQRVTWGGVLAAGAPAPVAAYYMSGSDVGGDIEKYEPKRNLLLSSADLTSTWANVASSVVATATTLEDDSALALEGLQQTVILQSGIAFEWEVTVAKDSTGRAARFPMVLVSGADADSLKFDTQTGESDPAIDGVCSSSSVSDAGSYWQVSMFCTADQASISLQVFPARGAATDWASAASATGTITIIQQQLCLGTCAAYQQTNSEQSLWDFSGNGNHGSLGSNPTAADTNDPSYALWSRNLLAAGTTEDLTHASWTHTATTTDADTLTFTAQNDNITQIVATLAGVTYRACVNIQNVSGNTALTWQHTDSATGNTTALTIDGTDTRRCVSFLGKAGGGNVTFGIQDTNAAGQGAVNVNYWQVEAASTATAYTNPATESTVPGLDFDGTDDYVAIASQSFSAGKFTIITAFKKDDDTGYQSLYGHSHGSSGGTTLQFVSATSQDYVAGDFVCFGNGYNSGNAPRAIADPGEIVGGWHLISCSLSESTAQVWLDGSALSMRVSSTAAVAEITSKTITIGSATTAADRLDGGIAIIGRWPELTAAQICGDCDGLDGDNDGLMGTIARQVFAERGICIAGAEAAYCQ